MQTRRNDGRLWCRGVSSAAFRSALHDCLGQFLDEKRNSIGPRGDALHHDVREPLCTRDAFDQEFRIAPLNRFQLDLRRVALAAPCGIELRSACNDEQDRPLAHAADEQLHQLARRGVDPMRVFHQDEDGLPCSPTAASFRRWPRTGARACCCASRSGSWGSILTGKAINSAIKAIAAARVLAAILEKGSEHPEHGG